jgi:hypothetical protein
MFRLVSVQSLRPIPGRPHHSGDGTGSPLSNSAEVVVLQKIRPESHLIFLPRLSPARKTWRRHLLNPVDGTRSRILLIKFPGGGTTNGWPASTFRSLSVASSKPDGPISPLTLASNGFRLRRSGTDRVHHKVHIGVFSLAHNVPPQPPHSECPQFRPG